MHQSYFILIKPTKVYDTVILKDLINGKKILQILKILTLQKIILTDLNDLGAIHFLSFRDPCLGRDPYFKNY